MEITVLHLMGVGTIEMGREEQIGYAIDVGIVFLRRWTNQNRIAMIENLKVSYIKKDDLQVTLAPVAELEENLPYELAGLFAQIIEDSQVNRELVLKELADNLFCNIELKKDAV